MLELTRRLERIGGTLGLPALCVFAFGYVGGKAIANVGLGLLLLSFCLRVPACARMLLQDGLVRLSLVWMAYVLALGAWSAYLYPATQPFSSLVGVWSFAFIPLVALASRGDTRRVTGVLLLALAGVIFRQLADLNLGDGPLFEYTTIALDAGRNLAVLFIDVAATGCIALLVAVVAMKQRSAAWRVGVALCIVACLILLLLGWVAARSRVSLVMLPLAVVTLLILNGRGARLDKRLAWMVGGLFCAALAGLTAANFPLVMAEIAKDTDTWRAIFTGQLEAVAIDATGLRVHMWQLAFSKWIGSPLIGAGLSVGHFLSEDPQRPFLADFNHFHSSYVEILLRTGVIGAFFYLAAAGLVLAATRGAVREGRMPPGLRDFLVISLCIFVVLGATNSILFFQQGWHFIVLFGGLAYGYRWAPRSQERSFS